MKLLKNVLLLSIFTIISTAGYSESGVKAATIAIPVISTMSPIDTSAQSPVRDRAAQFTGLSLGINSGFIHVSADTSWVNYISTHRLQGYGGKYTTTAKGGFAGTHAIWGKVYPNKFYLGSEVTAAYNIVNGTTKDYVLYGKRFRYSLRDSYAATVRAGILAGEALLYLKGGVALSRRIVESQYMYDEAGNSIYKSNKYKAAPLIGLGFDLPIQNRVSLGLEVSYVKYPSDRVVHPNSALYTINTDTYDLKVKLTFKM